MQRLEALVEQQRQQTAGTTDEADRSEKGSEFDSDEDEDEDYVEILPEDLAKRRAKGPRCSVSAEAFGAFNKKEAF